MAQPKLTPLELRIMEALWQEPNLSVREILETFPAKGRPAYTTVQTTVYRLEEKGAVRRAKKVGNAHVFAAVITREAASRRLVDELLNFFGGRLQPVISHLVESGRMTMNDVREAEKLLKDLPAKPGKK